MDHDATEPLSKKVKARSKKNKPQDDDQAVSETEEPHNTKAPGKGKKATTELASEASEEEPKPKRGRKKAIQKEPNIAERSLKETKETNTSKVGHPWF